MSSDPRIIISSQVSWSCMQMFRYPSVGISLPEGKWGSPKQKGQSYDGDFERTCCKTFSDLCTSSIISCDKMASSYAPTAIIIGAGPGGISMAYRLKHELGFNDFLVIPIACSPIMRQVLTCCRYTKNWMV